MPMGVITEIWASAMLVASHRPPIPVSSTATSTGASANAANAMPVSTSNLLIAGSFGPVALSTIATNGSTSR